MLLQLARLSQRSPFPQLLLAQRAFIRCSSSTTAASTAQGVDHYKVLGVKRNANAKEIKRAFYEMSKKFHPDTNPDGDRQRAAEMFQKIVDAYEVLSSAEKRKVYDVTRYRSLYKIVVTPTRTGGAAQPAERVKRYEDLDIDYKDFEHFQRLNRSREPRYNEEDFPRTFREATGQSQRREEPTFTGPLYNYKDSKAYEREQEEKKLAEEMREREKKEKYPLPTFEKLIIDERERSKRAWREKVKGFVMCTVLLILCTLTMFRQ